MRRELGGREIGSEGWEGVISKSKLNKIRKEENKPRLTHNLEDTVIH